MNRRWRLNHVTFGYEKEEIVLSDCSFRVRQGETVTLAGRTGAGKSTIFKLILGLYSPQQGSVTIFGTPADQISDQQKRRLVRLCGTNVAAGQRHSQRSDFPV